MKRALARQIEARKKKGQSTEAAVQALLEYADDEMRTALKELLQERQVAVDTWANTIKVELDGGATSVDEDGFGGHRNWYLPTEGPRWSSLRQKMSSAGLASAVESIDRSSDQIVAQLAEPHSHQRRRGLVVGNVQSGKTANYAAVCTKALDVNYRFVLIFSGTYNNLRAQTQKRISRDLGVDDNPSGWIKLTTIEDDMQEKGWNNAAATVSSLGADRKMIAVMKKETSRLDYLLKFLDQLDEKTLGDTPILIVDDESDQATPDSSNDPEDNPSEINKKMRRIWSKIKNGTYVGYTATPFANVFMNPEDAGDPADPDGGRLESLYPKDFIHVMPTPKNYFGAEALFGMTGGFIDGESSDGLDVIRRIPSDELSELTPQRQKDAADFVPVVTHSLGQAIRWFIVACAIRRLRGQREKHSSMLVHTTQNVEPHFAMRDVIEKFLEPMKTNARDGDVSEFRSIFDEEESRVAELYTGDAPAPEWSQVAEEIRAVLRLIDVVVDNGSEDANRRLRYDDARPVPVIVIGGGTLSRGLTLEGLFVSFFTRSSKAYDTLLQMGRWFGYRPGYEDLQRIWLAEGLESDYQFLAQVESELRAEITRMASEGQTPEAIGIKIRRHPGRLEITGAAKMKHAHQVEYTYQGRAIQTTMFDFSKVDAQVGNVRAAESLIQRLGDQEVVKSTGAAHRVFTDVEFETVKGFFKEFSIHEGHDETHLRALGWAQKKLPNKKWRVVVASGNGNPLSDASPLGVRTVHRSPLADPEGHSINIRALMSAQDRVLDLKAMGTAGIGDVKSEPQQNTARRRPVAEGGADGEGLLVLYPISTSSPVSSRAAGGRLPMAEVLQKIDSSIPDTPGLNAIIGYALVLPSDTTGALDNDGDFLSVLVPGTPVEAGPNGDS